MKLRQVDNYPHDIPDGYYLFMFPPGEPENGIVIYNWDEAYETAEEYGMNPNNVEIYYATELNKDGIEFED